MDYIQQSHLWLSNNELFSSEKPPQFIYKYNRSGKQKKTDSNKMHLLSVECSSATLIATYEVIQDEIFIKLKNLDDKWYFLSVFSKDTLLSNNIGVITYILNIVYGTDIYGKSYFINYDSMRENINGKLSDIEVRDLFTEIAELKDGMLDTYIKYYEDDLTPSIIITCDYKVFFKCQTKNLKIIIN